MAVLDVIVAGDVPNVTLLTALRFVPVIVTVVPPASGPATGETLAMVGGGGMKHLPEMSALKIAAISAADSARL